MEALSTLTEWTAEDIELLRESAARLHPHRDLIAERWAERLTARLGPPFSDNPEAIERITELNRWFLEGHFQGLERGDLEAVFRENFESDLALLRAQGETDPEIRSSLPQLYLSLSLSRQVMVEITIDLYRNDPRLSRIIELNGRLGMILGEVLGRAFYEVRSEATQRALRIASSLLEVSRQLNARAASVTGVLRRLTDIVRRLVRCDQVIVFLWRDAEQAYVAEAAVGFSSEHFAEIRAMRFQRGTFSMMDDILDGRIASGTREDGRVPQDVMKHYDQMVYGVAPMHDPEGQPLGTLAAYRRLRCPFDRTDLEILKGVAQNAALAIDNARLVEKLEASSRLKTDFINSMSHEIRTPLNVLVGYEEMLGDHLAAHPEDQRILERMRQNTGYLLQLVNTILDVGRMEAGKVPLRIETFAAKDLLQGLQDAFGSMAETRGLEFACVVRGSVPPFRTDRLKLLEILNNLVANAFKFTDEGSIVVSVTGTGSDLVTFEVRDTGVGIEASALEEIFDVFRQGSNVDRGGTGLGLYIVKRLSGLLGGGVTVESEPGHGTIFRVTVPTALPEATLALAS